LALRMRAWICRQSLTENHSNSQTRKTVALREMWGRFAPWARLARFGVLGMIPEFNATHPTNCVCC
jgi:hypothetical protein